jgi:hypothetical protein
MGYEVEYDVGRGFRVWNTIVSAWETGWIKTVNGVVLHMKRGALVTARMYPNRNGRYIVRERGGRHELSLIGYAYGHEAPPGTETATPEEYAEYIGRVWRPVAERVKAKAEESGTYYRE